MTVRGFILLLMILLLSNCGQQAKRTPSSEVDTPEMHYDRGKQLLQRDEGALAESEFQHALALDPDFAPAYEGLGWCALARGETDLSFHLARESLKKSPNWPLARLVLARLYANEGKYSRAETAVLNAINLIPDAPITDRNQALVDAWLTMGIISMQAEKYQNARNAYFEVLEIDRLNMDASEGLDKLTVYQSVVIGQRPELAEIAAREKLTRADIAVLVVSEMPLHKWLPAPSRPADAPWIGPTGSSGENNSHAQPLSALPLDVDHNHWAKSYIMEVLDSGVMQAYPDARFQPDELINRAEFAIVLEKLLIASERHGQLASQFFGSPSPYRDIDRSSPVYNAIMLVSTRNLINGFADGTFRPLAAVSGAEALDVLRQLKARLP